jgi:hypothetical protein
MFYRNEVPDMDESVVLDALQSKYVRHLDPHGREVRECLRKGVYLNDRQVRERHTFHGIDAHNPRVEVMVEPMWAQQSFLDLQVTEDDPFAFNVARP